MDFDPSAFLAMAMTEDHDSVYTAPEMRLPEESPVNIPGNIVIEGGLQMEQDMQISIPMFGLLDQNEDQAREEETDQIRPEVSMQIDTGEHEVSTTSQPSPVERTSSPSIKKIIQTTFEETRFRKDLFCGSYERVKIFRLHCSICAKHIGCAPWHTERQMRTHKLLNVVVCRKCFEFYGDVNFPIEDGSELYCSWCGEGGECFCCSSCPKIVCKKCVKRNFGEEKVKEIDKNDDWACFVCKPEDIWPHRALMWGLQRWSRNMRQNYVMLPKEEKQAKLSEDTSQCCVRTDVELAYVSLPSKASLSRIPLCMVAPRYQACVLDVLSRPDERSNGFNVQNNQTGYTVMKSYPAAMPQAITNVPRAFPPQQNQIQRTMVPQYQNKISRNMVPQHQNIQPMSGSFPRHLTRALLAPPQQQISRSVVRFNMRQVVQSNMGPINRPTPYPMNRNVPKMMPPLPPVQDGPTPQGHSVQPPVYVSSPSPYKDHMDSARNSIPKPTKPPLLDISPIENGVKEVNNVLKPVLMMLDEFDLLKNDLSNDVQKLSSFSERLSHNIKIAICNLAKANADIAESHKKIIDTRVSAVVNNIQSAVEHYSSSTVNGTIIFESKNRKDMSSNGLNPETNTDSSPEIIEVNPNSRSETPESHSSGIEKATPATPVSSTGEEVEDLAIAMLCETVLEVGENKENKDNANKNQATPIKRHVIRKPVKGKPNVKVGRKRLRDCETPEIQIIDLVDDEETMMGNFNKHFWLKKFKIIPCKVVLERLEIHKVDVV